MEVKEVLATEHSILRYLVIQSWTIEHRIDIQSPSIQHLSAQLSKFWSSISGLSYIKCIRSMCLFALLIFAMIFLCPNLWQACTARQCIKHCPLVAVAVKYSALLIEQFSKFNISLRGFCLNRTQVMKQISLEIFHFDTQARKCHLKSMTAWKPVVLPFDQQHINLRSHLGQEL